MSSDASFFYWCILLCYHIVLGVQFPCWLAVLAFAWETWTPVVICYVWCLLRDGCGFCEEECDGNQRKITPRNRDCSSPPRIEVALNCLRLLNLSEWASEQAWSLCCQIDMVIHCKTGDTWSRGRHVLVFVQHLQRCCEHGCLTFKSLLYWLIITRLNETLYIEIYLCCMYHDFQYVILHFMTSIFYATFSRLCDN